MHATCSMVLSLSQSLRLRVDALELEPPAEGSRYAAAIGYSEGQTEPRRTFFSSEKGGEASLHVGPSRVALIETSHIVAERTGQSVLERPFGGRSYACLFRGQLAEATAERIRPELKRAFQPSGSSDGELLLSWVLSTLNGLDADTLRAGGWTALDDSFRKLAPDANALAAVVTDGESVLILRGGETSPQMHWYRLGAGERGELVQHRHIRATIEGREHVHCSTIAVSDCGDRESGWLPVAPGSCLAVLDGEFCWPSDLTHLGGAGEVSGDAPRSLVAISTGAHYYITVNDERVLNYAVGDAAGNAPAVGPQERGAVLRVVHRTTYSYTKEVLRSSHLFRLQPVHDLYQQVLDFSLRMTPHGPAVWQEDSFGNAAVEVRVEEPYRDLTIEASSTVRVFAPPMMKPLRSISIPYVMMPWQRQMLLPYLLPPELPESQLHELAEFGMGFVHTADFDVLDTLDRMNKAIYFGFEYAPNSTTLFTTAFEVLSKKRGVCQDFANLFICVARLLGFPARYRVGYVEVFRAVEAESGVHEATHAWAEVYLPWLGWRGFDPTNGSRVGEQHVRVAAGRNYGDATPTSGTIYGAAKEDMSIEVSVRRLADM